MWFEEILRQPDLCGGPLVTALRAFVDGAHLIAAAEGRLNELEWRKLRQFEAEHQHPDGRSLGPYSVFTSLYCEDETNAFYDLLKLLIEIAPAEAISDAIEPFDGDILDLLHLLKLRPGMYLYQPTATNLYAYVSGYLWASHFYERSSAEGDRERLNAFLDWYRTKWAGLDRRMPTWLNLLWYVSGVPGEAAILLDTLPHYRALGGR